MKAFIIILLTAIIILIAVIVFLWVSPLKSPPTGTCKNIIVNTGDKKINIVYLTDNVDEKEIKNFTDYFLNIKPFSSSKEKFNFYYAGKANCTRIEDYVLCYSRTTIQQSSICPNNYVIVLTDQPSEVRSSAYINLISLNINSPYALLLHEFGHSFANLADEYTPSNIPRGSQNCNKKCPIYGDIQTCFLGCSKENYYRSTENSVMRALDTEDFGELNNLLIQKNLDRYG
jgi:uncharacterized protein (UPF0333 family)